MTSNSHWPLHFVLEDPQSVRLSERHVRVFEWLLLHNSSNVHPQLKIDIISNAFEREWNFAHCFGGLDDKHVMMESPQNAGSTFYNYKNFHSLVLLAICDAKCWFTFVDIDEAGSGNDTNVLSNSHFGRTFEYTICTFRLPEPGLVWDKTIPYVLIEHDMSALKSWLMK